MRRMYLLLQPGLSLSRACASSYMKALTEVSLQLPLRNWKKTSPSFEIATSIDSEVKSLLKCLEQGGLVDAHENDLAQLEEMWVSSKLRMIFPAEH